MWQIKNVKSREKRRKHRTAAQVTVEFVFSMILVMLMTYGLIKVFRWGGVSLAERRMAHEQSLMMNIDENWGTTYNIVIGNTWYLRTSTMQEGPLSQLDPNFMKPRKMCAVYGDCP